MSGWVKVPAEWFDQRAIERLPGEVIVLHLSALAHCARLSSDGHLERGDLRKLRDTGDTDGAVARLVADGHWQETAVGWLLLEWRDFVLSADEVERRRATSRETTERFRRHKAGDHSMCDRCAVVRGGPDVSPDTSRDTSGDLSGDSTPDRSVPKGRRGRGEPAPDSAGAPSTPFARHAFDPAECCPLPPEHPVHQRLEESA